MGNQNWKNFCFLKNKIKTQFTRFWPLNEKFISSNFIFQKFFALGFLDIWFLGAVFLSRKLPLQKAGRWLAETRSPLGALLVNLLQNSVEHIGPFFLQFSHLLKVSERLRAFLHVSGDPVSDVDENLSIWPQGVSRELSNLSSREFVEHIIADDGGESLWSATSAAFITFTLARDVVFVELSESPFDSFLEVVGAALAVQHVPDEKFSPVLSKKIEFL